ALGAGLPAARLDRASLQAVSQRLVSLDAWGIDLRLGGTSFQLATAGARQQDERALLPYPPTDLGVAREEAAGALALEERTQEMAFADALDLVFANFEHTGLLDDRFVNEP